MELESKIPPGPLADKWAYAKAHYKLINPSNKRKYDILIVGSGLAGASALGGFNTTSNSTRMARRAPKGHTYRVHSPYSSCPGRRGAPGVERFRTTAAARSKAAPGP